MACAKDPIAGDASNVQVRADVSYFLSESRMFMDKVNRFNATYGVVTSRNPLVVKRELSLFVLFKLVVQNYQVCPYFGHFGTVKLADDE